VADDEEGYEIEMEGFYAARELGILFLKKRFAAPSDDFIDEKVSVPIDDSDDTSSIKIRIEEPKDQTAIETPIEQNENSFMEDTYKSFIRKCDTCGLKFKRDSHLRNHNRRFHPGVKNALCDHCGKTFATLKYRDVHIETIHSENKARHSAKPLLPCPQCGNLVKHVDMHIKHMHAENEGPYPCQDCGKIFRKQIHVSRHMAFHLPEEIKLARREKEKGKHTCSNCDKGFVSITKLKFHVAAKHTGIRHFQCKQCSKSYFRSDHLKTHVKSLHGS